MSNPRAVEAVVRHLTELGPLTELVWCEGAQQLLEEVHLGTYVDITVNTICDALELPWLWTVVQPDDAEAPAPGDRSLVIPVATDLVVWAVYDPDQRWFRAASAIALPMGEEPAAEELVALYEEADDCHGTIEMIAAWRSSTIDQALEDWCAHHTGRADLRFCEDRDGIPRFLQLLIEQSGAGDVYQIDEYVSVSDQVFDQLLAMDPEQAAAITEAAQRIARTHFGYDGDVDKD